MMALKASLFPNSLAHLWQNIVLCILNPFLRVPPPILLFWIGKWRQSCKPLTRCDRWRNETAREKIFFTISKIFFWISRRLWGKERGLAKRLEIEPSWRYWYQFCYDNQSINESIAFIYSR